MRHIIFFILFSLSTSVAALEKNFTYECDDELADEVQAAITKWSTATNGVFTATRVDRDPDIKIRAVDKIGAKLRGWTETENGVVGIRIVRNCPHRDTVVLHEFGHAFGLGHSKNPDSIMFWVAKDEPTLSAEDEQRIQRRWGKKR